MQIAYKSGYKYQIVRPLIVNVGLAPGVTIITPFIELDDGQLKIKSGYAWDGPSGPTIDTPSFMRGSLVHDALYQLMREGFLDTEVYREQADRILKEICLEDGMWAIRAEFVYSAVRRYGCRAAEKQDGGVIYAP
jgi:hypothetical protein